jgi:phosphate-selective porin
MKTLSYTLCAILAAGFAFTGDAQVKPKSKKVTELKFSGRLQGQFDGIETDDKTSTPKEDRNHFYFRRLFLGGHAKMGDNWGADLVLDFAASPNSETSSYDKYLLEWKRPPLLQRPRP